MNRRSFLAFLAGAPVAVVAALKARRVPSFERIWRAIDGTTTADKTKGLLWHGDFPPPFEVPFRETWDPDSDWWEISDPRVAHTEYEDPFK